MDSNDNEETGLILLDSFKENLRPPVIDDPLEDLLNEFSDYEDEEEELPETSLDELKEFLEQEESLVSCQKTVVDDQINTLKEVYGRIKYYMDEISSHFAG